MAEGNLNDVFDRIVKESQNKTLNAEQAAQALFDAQHEARGYRGLACGMPLPYVACNDNIDGIEFQTKLEGKWNDAKYTQTFTKKLSNGTIEKIQIHGVDGIGSSDRQVDVYIQEPGKQLVHNRVSEVDQAFDRFIQTSKNDQLDFNDPMELYHAETRAHGLIASTIENFASFQTPLNGVTIDSSPNKDILSKTLPNGTTETIEFNTVDKDPIYDRDVPFTEIDVNIQEKNKPSFHKTFKLKRIIEGI